MKHVAGGSAPNQEEARAAAAVERHPFRRVILGAWADLFRPRERLLLEVYRRSPDITPRDMPPPATLSEARARAESLAPTSDIDRDTLETQMVRTTRLLAAWLAFWSTIVPFIGIVAFATWRLRRIQGRDWIEVGVIGCSSLILFPLLAILGLILQAPLMRPFVAVTTRLLRISTDEPSWRDAPSGADDR